MYGHQWYSAAPNCTNISPIGKGMAALLLLGWLGSVVIPSLAGLFASNKKLESMSKVIGTKKPIIARIVFALSLLVSAFIVFGLVALCLE